MKTKLTPFQNKSLLKREEQNSLRILSKQNYSLSFGSNDYLSLQQNKEWLSYLKSEIPEDIIFSSSVSSRLIQGNSTIKEQTEKQFASFYKAESALFYASGYSANIGVFSCIASKNDTIIYDALVHTSIREGLRLSYAKTYSFKHNCLENLKTKLQKATGSVFVVIESLYSMDGDIAPLKEISELCTKHNAKLIIDEAHSTAIFGEKGEGLVVEQNLQDSVYLRLMTFGKAVSASGGLVLCSEELRTFLINFSRPFIYTTAPADFTILKAFKSVEFIAKNKIQQTKLKENIKYFTDLLEKNKVSFLKGISPIIPIFSANLNALKNVEQELKSKNIFVKTILSPTVPKGKERIRISIQTEHSNEQLEFLANFLAKHL